MNRSGRGRERGRGRGRGRDTGRVRSRTLQRASWQSMLQDDVRTQGPKLESRDSEVFVDTILSPKDSTVTRVGFQNIGPQPNCRRNNKTRHNDGAMTTGAYGVALFAEHCLNPAKLKSGQLWFDRMSMEASTRGSFSSFGYNKQELIRARWKQTGGTTCTVSKQFRSMLTSH